MADILHKGGCQCGKVRFEATGTPKFVGNCHCASCRKATGAVYSTFIGFEARQVRWVKETPAYHASSPGVKRGFCPDCGTPLTYAGEKWPGETHILIGAFDDPENYPPQGEVFTGEALPFAYERPTKN
ncbi:GFA family protein [Hyphococcus flavus]|uniref:GFA family protein n=1 Tax=Hyphococcus flavus TaxID=1866326 RepID=A0AAE9ZDJ0_9PROT|nr:GFA family protein [Hyphococcus flavus]WDI30663.1 GFA family protein [Hyphococcus flavus]